MHNVNSSRLHGAPINNAQRTAKPRPTIAGRITCELLAAEIRLWFTLADFAAWATERGIELTHKARRARNGE